MRHLAQVASLLLSEALHPGKARAAIVDRVCIWASGCQAKAWLGMEPRARRLRLSWTRKDPSRILS